MRRLKTLLIATMLTGAVVSAGSHGGTFASFSAETTNAGSQFATGTLLLSNQVQSGTVCVSSAGVTDNASNCPYVLQISNNRPGQINATATVTVTNTGSLDASKLYLFMRNGCTDVQLQSFSWNPVGQSGSPNPLCNVTIMSVQENGTNPWCWYGLGAGTQTCDTSSGAAHQDSDTTHTLTNFATAYTGVSDSSRTISVTANGTTALTSSGQFLPSDAGRSLSGTGVPVGTTILSIQDTSHATASNAVPTGTISTATLSAMHGIELQKVVAGAPLSGVAELAAGTSSARRFTIGLYLPLTSGNQNALQGLQSTFALTWRIEQ